MEWLKAGGASKEAAVAALRHRVVELSFDAVGCRVVQQALQEVVGAVASKLASELRGHIREAIRNKHANYVVQKVLELLPLSQARFVLEELCDIGPAAVARHRYGCRIISRLLEHSANDAGAAALIDEVLQEADGLCRHAFGRFVVQSILEHGSPEHRRRIAAALCGVLSCGKLNRNACHVVEGALAYCSAEDRAALADGLSSWDSDRLAELMRHQFGSDVLRALLQIPEEGAQRIRVQLRAVAGQLQDSKNAQRLLDDFGLVPASEEAGRSCPDAFGAFF